MFDEEAAPVGPATPCSPEVSGLEFFGSAPAEGDSALVCIQGCSDYQVQRVAILLCCGESSFVAWACQGEYCSISFKAIGVGGGFGGVESDERLSFFTLEGEFLVGEITTASGNPLALISPNGYDLSHDSGTGYLLTGGMVYTLSDSKVATLLGAAPNGTVAVFADLSEPATGVRNGGGAVGPGLLALLGMALLIRRARRFRTALAAVREGCGGPGPL